MVFILSILKTRKTVEKQNLNAFPPQGFSFFILKFITIVFRTTKIQTTKDRHIEVTKGKLFKYQNGT